MKKIPKFWKIYIFTVTAVILLFCVLLIVLGGFLRSYEITSQEKKAAERAEESQRIYDEREAAERQSGAEISKHTALLSAVSNAARLASSYAEDSIESSADHVMTALVSSLNEKGASAVSSYADFGLSKYEDQTLAVNYIDGIQGAYSCEKITDLEYELKKSGISASVKLKEEQNAEKDRKTYGISSITFSLPLSSYVVIAPSGSRVTVNGADVTDTPEYKKPDYADMIPSSFSVPNEAHYEFAGFINKPEIKAYTDGKECSGSSYDGGVTFSSPSNEQYKAELFDRICELSFAYSDFVAGAFNFESMRTYLYSGTKLYDYLSTFDNRWYYDFHHIVNENAKIKSLTVLSDNLVAAQIEFNQSLRSATDRTYDDIKIELTVYVGCSKVPAGTDKSAWLLVSVG